MNQKKLEEESKDLIKIENIYVGAIERGLSIEDMDEMDLGDIIDYVVMYNNMHEDEDTESTRKATQEDWNNL